MRGILASLATNIFTVGQGAIPTGAGTNEDLLSEDVLNAALRAVWDQSAGTIDTIVCGGFQKRRINGSSRFHPKPSDVSTCLSLSHVVSSCRDIVPNL